VFLNCSNEFVGEFCNSVLVKLNNPYPLYPVEVFSFISPEMPNSVSKCNFNHSTNLKGRADLPVAIPPPEIIKKRLLDKAS